MKKIVCTLLIGMGTASADDATLPSFWQAVKNQHPTARMAAATLQAAEGEYKTARSWDNPELSVEGENLGGDFSGTDEAEWTLALEQAVEWPGRRSRRLQIAKLERTTQTWKSKDRMRALANDVAEVFYETLALQEKMLLHMEAVEQADAFVKMADRRMEAGTSTILEANKARLERARHELQLAGDEQTLLNALERIGRMAGWDRPPEVLLGNLLDAPEPPDQAAITRALQSRASYAIPGTKVTRQELALKNAKRAWLPDFVLSGGVRQNDADESQSYVAGVGLSLPIWNRSTRTVTARAELEQARSEQDLALQNLETAARESHAALDIQWKTIQRYRGELLPLLAQHATQAKTSYEEGWTGYLEYLDARSDYREMQSSYIDTLKTYHKNLHAIRPLTETSDDQ